MKKEKKDGKKKEWQRKKERKTDEERKRERKNDKEKMWGDEKKEL